MAATEQGKLAETVDDLDYDPFDATKNGGRQVPTCACSKHDEPAREDEDDGPCEHECPATHDDWPCIYVKQHPGAHMSIWGREWR